MSVAAGSSRPDPRDGRRSRRTVAQPGHPGRRQVGGVPPTARGGSRRPGWCRPGNGRLDDGHDRVGVLAAAARLVARRPSPSPPPRLPGRHPPRYRCFRRPACLRPGLHARHRGRGCPGEWVGGQAYVGGARGHRRTAHRSDRRDPRRREVVTPREGVRDAARLRPADRRGAVRRRCSVGSGRAGPGLRGGRLRSGARSGMDPRVVR